MVQPAARRVHTEWCLLVVRGASGANRHVHSSEVLGREGLHLLGELTGQPDDERGSTAAPRVHLEVAERILGAGNFAHARAKDGAPDVFLALVPDPVAVRMKVRRPCKRTVAPNYREPTSCCTRW